jgi:regulator of replication initiation timing
MERRGQVNFLVDRIDDFALLCTFWEVSEIRKKLKTKAESADDVRLKASKLRGKLRKISKSQNAKLQSFATDSARRLRKQF